MDEEGKGKVNFYVFNLENMYGWLELS